MNRYDSRSPSAVRKNLDPEKLQQQMDEVMEMMEDPQFREELREDMSAWERHQARLAAGETGGGKKLSCRRETG